MHLDLYFNLFNTPQLVHKLCLASQTSPGLTSPLQTFVVGTIAVSLEDHIAVPQNWIGVVEGINGFPFGNNNNGVIRDFDEVWYYTW